MAMSAARFSSWELDLATPSAAADRSAPLEHIREAVLEEDAARLNAAVQATIDGRGDLHTEYRAKDPGTGETMWFESHATRVGGHLGRLSGITRDVTDQKRAEEDRRRGAAHQTFLLELSDSLRTAPDAMGIKAETTRRLRAHLDVAWCAYARIDPTGAVATIVREAARPGLASLLGAHALPRRPEIAELLGAGDVLAIPDLAKPGALDPGQAERYAALGMRGALAVPLLQEARPAALLLVADTRPRAWTAGEIDLVRDVAERTWIAVGRARAEAALRASETRLQLADRAKDDFLATLGHELRTPLAAILLWGEALRSGKLPSGEHPRALEAIVECAKAQSILIDDLLDLSRLVTGKLRLSPESVDVAEVARGLDAIVRPMAVAKGVALIADVAPDLGRVEIDVSRLRQVLWNLLSNAIKFTPAGGTVTSTVQRRDGHLELVVTDTGEGFGPAFAEHLFERFRQADMGESRRHGGLGIGLALSRELVELQGGTITAESAGPEKGATFCVRLPWVPGRASSGAPPLARGSARSVAPPPLAGVTVVLAEDEPHTRAAMESALEQAGATVLGVSSGKAALEALAAVDAAATPVVLVSDLGLPGMTGYELVAHAAAERAARGEAPLPACAVSSHARDTDRRRAIDAGFDIYVAKPVMPDDLVEAVADLVPMTRG